MSPYITIAEVAKILDWNWDKASRWLESAGAIVVRAGRRMTTREKLKECFPEIYSELQMAAYDPDLDDFSS